MPINQMFPRTACGLLEVNSTATKAEIDKAYKKLALKFHPDKNAHIAEAAKEAFQLIQEAKEVLTNATRPFYKLEESPFQEEKQKALAAKAELRKKQFFRRRMSTEDWPSEREEKKREQNNGENVAESMRWGAFFGNQGQWVCQTCDKSCMVLRDVNMCDFCGHSLKLHTGPGHSLHLPGDYCGGFMMKLKSEKCACGCPCSSHKCVFTKAGSATPRKGGSTNNSSTPRREKAERSGSGGGAQKQETSCDESTARGSKTEATDEAPKPFVHTPFNLYGMNAEAPGGPRLGTVFEAGNSCEEVTPSDENVSAEVNNDSHANRNAPSSTPRKAAAGSQGYAQRYNVTPPSMQRDDTPADDDSSPDSAKGRKWEPAAAKYGGKYMAGGSSSSTSGAKPAGRKVPKLRPSVQPFQSGLRGKHAMSCEGESKEKGEEKQEDKKTSKPTPRNAGSMGPTPRGGTTDQKHFGMMGDLQDMAREVLGGEFNLATGRTPRIPREKHTSNSPPGADDGSPGNPGPTINWGTFGHRPSVVNEGSPKSSKDAPSAETTAPTASQDSFSRKSSNRKSSSRTSSMERKKDEVHTEVSRKCGQDAPRAHTNAEQPAISAVERAFLSAQSKIEKNEKKDAPGGWSRKPLPKAERKQSKTAAEETTPSTLTPRSSIGGGSDRSSNVTPLQKQKPVSENEKQQSLERNRREKTAGNKSSPRKTTADANKNASAGIQKKNVDKQSPATVENQTISAQSSSVGSKESSPNRESDEGIGDERKRRKTFSLFFIDSEDGKNRNNSKEATKATTSYASKVSPRRPGAPKLSARQQYCAPRGEGEPGGQGNFEDSHVIKVGDDLLENTNSLFSSHFNWDERNGGGAAGAAKTGHAVDEKERSVAQHIPMGGFITSAHANSSPGKIASPGKQAATPSSRRAQASYPLSSPTRAAEDAVRTPVDVDASPGSLQRREERLRRGAAAATAELPGRKSSIYDNVRSSGYSTTLKLKKQAGAAEDNSPRKDRTPKTSANAGNAKNAAESKFGRLLKKYG